MNMKEYESYRNSGLDWIGKIPVHWKCAPFKWFMHINNGRDYKNFVAESGIPVIGSGGRFAYASDYLYDGEALLLGRKGTIDHPMYINGKFWTVDTMFYAVPKRDVSCKYMYYQSLGFPFGLYSTETALPSMTQSDLGNNPVCLPPYEEQLKIVSFLDGMVDKIDNVIKDKESVIEDLQNYRKSILSEILTHGLKSEKTMKDSCNECVGEIPSSWNIIKLARCTTKIGSGKTPSGGADVYTSEGIMFVRSQNVYNDGLRTDDIVFIPEEIDNTMIGTRVQNDDVLLNITGGSIGRCCHIDDPFIRANVNQHVCIIRTIKDKLNAKFLQLCVTSEIVQRQIKCCQTGSNREELNFEQIGNFVIPFPPYKEQEQIANYLNTKIECVSTAINELQLQINDIKTYKSSLIIEAVTGKIDLRLLKI